MITHSPFDGDLRMWHFMKDALDRKDHLDNVINQVALDRAVRRCRLLLSLCRKHGIDREDVRVMMPLIVELYREELAR